MSVDVADKAKIEDGAGPDVNRPCVDILMATYNGEKYLTEQLDSLIAQTYTNWRLFISDDGSDDATVALLHSYADKDARISIVSEGVRIGGPRRNFSSLLPFSTSPYCMFCDQDDVWDVLKIEKTLQAMLTIESQEEQGLPIAVFSDLRVVDSKLRVLNESFAQYRNQYPPNLDFGRLLRTNVAPGCAMMVNRSLKKELNKMEDNRYIVMHDWWAMLIAAAFGRVCFLDVPLMSYRLHGENCIGAVKYQPLRFVRLIGIARASKRSIWQASEFQEVYGSELDADKKKRLKAYVGSLNGGPAGLYRLHKSNGWCNTAPDRLGQALSTLIVLPAMAFVRRMRKIKARMR